MDHFGLRVLCDPILRCQTMGHFHSRERCVDERDGQDRPVSGGQLRHRKGAIFILADMGYHMVMLCRDETKDRKAYWYTIHREGRKVDLMFCNLRDIGSLDNFVAYFKKGYEKLDVIMENTRDLARQAGDPRWTGALFEVDQKGQSLLIMSLFDILELATPARIGVYSAGAHKAGRVRLGDRNLERR